MADLRRLPRPDDALSFPLTPGVHWKHSVPHIQPSSESGIRKTTATLLAQAAVRVIGVDLRAAGPLLTWGPPPDTTRSSLACAITG